MLFTSCLHLSVGGKDVAMLGHLDIVYSKDVICNLCMTLFLQHSYCRLKLGRHPIYSVDY